MTRLERRGSTVQVQSVEIADGLPYLLFGRVLGHEIGHGFLAGCPTGSRTLAVDEGLCELISFWWLSAQSGDVARHLERTITENPDPVYGAGFRQSLAMTRGHAITQVVGRLRARGSL
jgi:hypothetical protein